VLTCVHHVSWIRPVDGGLHQCIQCHQAVRRSDVYPKLEDLPEEVRRRWDEHEKRGAAETAPPAASAASPAGAGDPGTGTGSPSR
jgi:hypothetical protein